MLRHFIMGFSVIPAIIILSSCGAQEQVADHPTENTATEQVETSDNPFAAAARERELADSRAAVAESAEDARVAQERARVAQERARAAAEDTRALAIQIADEVIADPSSDPFDTLSPSVQAEIRAKYEACVADGRDFAAEEEDPRAEQIVLDSWVDSCNKSRAAHIRSAVAEQNMEELTREITSSSN